MVELQIEIQAILLCALITCLLLCQVCSLSTSPVITCYVLIHALRYPVGFTFTALSRVVAVCHYLRYTTSVDMIYGTLTRVFAAVRVLQQTIQ